MEETESSEEVGGGTSESVTFGGLIDDQEQEKREDRKLAGELTAFFNGVDRTITMLRVYPFGHPLQFGLVEQQVNRLQKVFEDEPSVVFNVEAQELKTPAGTTVYSEEMSEKNQYIWYTVYADGILQVQLDPDVTADELNQFLRVVEKSAAGQISSDDDTVTLLWESQLETISYYAVEGFVDSGTLEDFGDRTEQEAIDLVVDAAIDPSGEEASALGGLFDNLSMAHLDLFTKMQIEANAKIIVPELRDQDLAYAFAIDPSLVDKLYDEWSAGADLEYRLIEALLSIIRVAPQSTGATRAAEMILSVTHQLLDSQMYEQAVRILELLHSRRELFFDTEVDPLGELLETLSDPMQVEALLSIFQRQVKQRETLMRLFGLLGSENVLKQILALLADSNRQVVALSQLVDLVFELTDQERESLITHPDYIGKSIYLRRLMSELPDRDFVEWRPTSRLIRKAIEDPDPEVRELALGLKHPCWDDPRLAENYLVPMADDPDEKIRKLSLALLGDKHPQLFQDAIRDTILARKMGDRTHAELRFLMRVFLDSSPEAAGYLRGLLDVKGWFGGDAVEFAKMAAAVLVEANDQEAYDKVKTQQGKLLTAPALKKAYERILNRFASDDLSEASEVHDAAPDSSATAAASKMAERAAPEATDRPGGSTGAPAGNSATPKKAPPRDAIEVPDDFDLGGDS